MKEIISISVTAKKADLKTLKVDLLCVGIFDNIKTLDEPAKSIDKKIGNAIAQVIKLGDFKGKINSTAVVYTNGKIPAKRILLVGLGDQNKADINTIRNAAAIAAKKAVAIKTKTMALALQQSMPADACTKYLAKAMAEGAFFGGYVYDEYMSDKTKATAASLKVTIADADSDAVKLLKEGAEAGSIIGAAQNIARTYANRPANVVYPEQLAAEAKAIAKQVPGLKCTVYDYKKLQDKKMGGIIAVGQGSTHKPALIIMEYSPPNAVNEKPVAMIGKAVTFDSGGISIKPAANMDQMKMDMTGGAVVLAAIKAAAQLKLPIKVTSIICAAENSPDGRSYRPGDIITTYSGKTVEILNTDAEGRMCLCDGIALAKEMKCEPIVDIATLTGACAVALGEHKAGLMGNDCDLIDQLKTASKNSDEPLWHLPSGDAYTEEMKSKIADLKNIGSRYGGACSAASFLGEFAEKTKWAHLDIAGKMEASEPQKNITSAGSVGFGVRIFVAWLTKLASKE